MAHSKYIQIGGNQNDPIKLKHDGECWRLGKTTEYGWRGEDFYQHCYLESEGSRQSKIK